jgi:hypothetical protein
MCEGMRENMAFIVSESHIASLGRESFLMLHDMDHIFFSIRSEFLAIRIGKIEDIPCEFDRHNLRPETDTEIRDIPFSSEMSREDHPLNPPIPEPTGHADPIESLEHMCPESFDIFCLDKVELHSSL